MLCLQVTNRISLVLDKYVGEGVMINLKGIVEGARGLPNYGMSSVIDLIESNIFKNVYTTFEL